MPARRVPLGCAADPLAAMRDRAAARGPIGSSTNSMNGPKRKPGRFISVYDATVVANLTERRSPSEKFPPVPPIASTVEHIGEPRLEPRDQLCFRPPIGTQTPWHDIRWLWVSLRDAPINCSRMAKFPIRRYHLPKL